MKRILLYVLLFAVLGMLASWGYPAASPPAAFSKGEFLKYRVHYGFVTAGYVSAEVGAETAWVQGKRCHRLRVYGQTSPSFDLVFKCRDTYESFVEEQSLLPLQFRRDLHEGGFHHYSEVSFDHAAQIARYYDAGRGSQQFKVPPGIQDVISAFYYARSRYDADKLRPGDRISLQNFLDRKTFGLEAVLLGRETLTLDKKRYKALKMSLLVQEAGLVTDDSRITLWISDDRNKIPLQVSCDLKIGAVKADLVQYSGLSHAFEALLP